MGTEEKQLGREIVGAEYVYLAVEQARAAEQLGRRRALLETGPVAPTTEIEVLLEVIGSARIAAPDAAGVAERLSARGIRISEAEVNSVFLRFGLKKTALSPSRRSPR